MGALGQLRQTFYAAALLAVALLGFASSQSIVMRAVPAAAGMQAMTMCVSGPTATRLKRERHADTNKTCAFCAAAAHAPLCSSASPIPASAAAAWTRYAAHASLGPRGPPEFTPQAQGPPQAA